MSEKKITIAVQRYPPEVEKAVLDALANDRWVLGEAVREFEERFARYIGTDYAVAVSNGTVALLAIYEALGLRGKRLVTTPYTFVATAAAASFIGAEVFFADIRRSDACLDPSRAVETARRIGAEAVVPVHIFGYPAPLEELVEEGFVVVEDVAQAHGAVIDGRKAGSIGVAGAFSFYPSKNMTVAGDGGMVTTSDEKLYKRILMIRDNGRVSKYTHAVAGLNLRLNTINAAIGLVMLRHLDEWNEKRRMHARLYHEGLRGLAEQGLLELPPLPDKRRVPAYNTYPVLARPEHRDALGAYLWENGVYAPIFYPIPLHRQPLYSERFAGESYPVAEEWSRRVLNLPVHQFLEHGDIEYVVEKINTFYEKQLYMDKEWLEKGRRWISGMR